MCLLPLTRKQKSDNYPDLEMSLTAQVGIWDYKLQKVEDNHKSLSQNLQSTSFFFQIVEDITDAHIDALHYLQQGGESQILNCGYVRNYSVRKVIDQVKTLKR